MTNPVSKSPPPGTVLVPAGPFELGNNSDWNTKPQIKIDLPAFFIDEHQFTNGEYRAFEKKYGTASSYLVGNSCTTGVMSIVARGNDAEALRKQKGILEHQKGNDQNLCSLEVVTPGPRMDFSVNSYFNGFNGEEKPVVGVDWYAAEAACEAKGKGWHLPTEAQWEKTAKGKVTFYKERHPAQVSITKPPRERLGSVLGGDAQVDADTTADVCSYQKRVSGVCDMPGNVLEWTATRYAEDAYQNFNANFPLGPFSGDSRVVRGSTWKAIILFDVTNRGYRKPEEQDILTGFRCAKDVDNS